MKKHVKLLMTWGTFAKEFYEHFSLFKASYSKWGEQNLICSDEGLTLEMCSLFLSMMEFDPYLWFIWYQTIVFCLATNMVHSSLRKQICLYIYVLPLNCIKNLLDLELLCKTLKSEECSLLVLPMNYRVTIMVLLLALKTLWCILQQCTTWSIHTIRSICSFCL